VFSKSTTCGLGLLLAIFSCLAPGQATPASVPAQSARKFVEEFYRWYVPKAPKPNAVELALKDRGDAFSPELLGALREDSAAQAKATGEIVGIDFDPFLGGQDPRRHYEVGGVTQKGEGYWVEVYGMESGKRTAQPDMIAEVQRLNGHWVFVNFHFPDGGDLLKTLRILRQERQEPPRNRKP
jgi:hypothetical protein